MLPKYTFLLFAFLLVFSFPGLTQIKDFQKWLALPATNRPELANQLFARKPLSRQEAEQVKILLLQDYKNRVKTTLQKEWEQKQFTSGAYIFQFEYKTFGVKPTDGRSLYISLHGAAALPNR